MIANLILGVALAVPVPDIVTREEWGANQPVIDLEEHEIVTITIHHTGTRQNEERTLEDKLRGLQSFSQSEGRLASGKFKPAWADIPYHYYIDVTGRIGEGRSIEYPGDSNTSYNPAGHALIVVEGSFPLDELRPEQKESLYELTAYLADKYEVPANTILGHNDWTPGETVCPGTTITNLLPDLRQYVADRLAQ
ncbi:MAG: peptidoglycan recognition family protein [Fimbriimonadaceae bacterium]